MNFVKLEFFVVRISKHYSVFRHFLIVLILSMYLAGCGDGIRLPSIAELTEFENAGTDIHEKVLKVKNEKGIPYHEAYVIVARGGE